MLQATRRQVCQTPGQLNPYGIAQAKRSAMSDPIELRANGRIDSRVAVAMDIAPQAADPIEIAVASGIVKPATRGSFNHQRPVVGHLRKRMPVVALVPVAKLFGCRHGGVSGQ